MKIRKIPYCKLCGAKGKAIYSHLKDRRFTAKEEWNLYKCPRCKLFWLNPQPVEAEIYKTYPRGYYTQKLDAPSKKEKILAKLTNSVLRAHCGYKKVRNENYPVIIGYLLGIIPFFRDIALRRVMFLEGPPNGAHLDIGCGGGWFLKKVRDLGWKSTGIETDQEAVKTAKTLGIPVIQKSLKDAGIPESSFNIITMRHVIEHVQNPSSLLDECYRILKPGGKLIIITPNNESLGYKIFQKHWRGLDIPRHLFIFSSKTLRQMITQSNLTIKICRTLTPEAYTIGKTSRDISSRNTMLVKITALLFLLLEESLHLFRPAIGEELLVIAIKPATR